jgi:H+/Cl- antiporter ClcA
MKDASHDSQATEDLVTMVGLGMLAGLAGSVVMTAFQKLIEMPISEREDSYQPAKLAQKLLPIDPPEDHKARKRLNYAMHFALGAMWGGAYGVAAYRGLRGSHAVSRVFPIIYTNDVAVGTSLGLGKPWKWSRKEFTIDVVDKFVQVAATSFIFDRLLDPKRRS